MTRIYKAEARKRYENGEKIISETTKSIKEAGIIAQSYETFLKYYKQN